MQSYVDLLGAKKDFLLNTYFQLIYKRPQTMIVNKVICGPFNQCKDHRL